MKNNQHTDNKRRVKNYRDEFKGKKPRNTDATEGSGVSKGLNDPSWYSANPEILKSAASLPFSNMLGTPIAVESDGMTGSQQAVPGICTLHWAPSLGCPQDASAPINTASKVLYSWVRHANSGSKNYDSPDLMLYVMAVGGCYSFLAELNRLYGSLQTYSVKNRYYAKAVVESMGYDFTDLSGNMAQLRYEINQFALKLSSFAIPTGMTLFARHNQLNANIYLDSPSAKAQTYLFVQDLYYKFNELDGAGRLDPIFWHGYYGNVNVKQRSDSDVLHTLSDIRTMMHELLDPIVFSEDMNIMSGDILKAYGESGIHKVDVLPIDYQVMPVYQPEILGQINNFTGCGFLPGTGENNQAARDTWSITQDVTIGSGGPLLCTPVCITGTVVPNEVQIYNAQMDNPEPGTIMVGTRFMAISNTDDYTLYGGNPESFVFARKIRFSGTEIPLYVAVTTYGRRTTDGVVEYVPLITTVESGIVTSFYREGTSGEGISTALRDIASPYNAVKAVDILRLMSTFDWAPKIYHYSINTDNAERSNEYGSPDYVYRGVITDFNDFTTIDKETLKNMHATALLSEFTSPQVAAWTKAK